MPDRPTAIPELVSLYLYGALSQADRLRVERAFLTDLRVQRAFVRFDALPDNILYGNDPEVAETVAAVMESMIRRGLLTPKSAKPPKPAKLPKRNRRPRTEPVPAEPVREEPRGYRYSKELDFVWPLRGAPKRSCREEMKEHFELDADGIIRFQCAGKDNPNGLIWMILREPEGVETRKLLELEFNKKGETWWSKIALTQIYGERAADVKRVVPGFVPATERNRDEFNDPEVRRFVESLPEGCRQRERAERYLNGGETLDG